MRAFAGNALELVEQLLLLDGFGGRIDLLGARRRSGSMTMHARSQCAHDQSDVPEQDAIVSSSGYCVPASCIVGTADS